MPSARAFSWWRDAFGRSCDFAGLWPAEAFATRSFSWRAGARRLTVVNNGRAARRVLAGNARAYRKGDLVRYALRPLVGDGLFLSEGEPWRQRRRQFQPLFDTAQLADFVGTVADCGETLLERWGRLPRGEPLSLSYELSAVTADAISRHYLGTELDGHTIEVFGAFDGYQRAVNRLLPLALAGLPQALLHGINLPARRCADRLARVMTALERSHTPQEIDLFALLDQLRVPARERRDELLTFFLAGHETTALTLGWCFLELARSPEQERRLHEEVDRVLGDRRPLPDDLDALPYTRAVVAETLRLYPPLPLLSRHALEDDIVDAVPIPAGSEVLVVPWLAQRHRGYWPDPDAFRPERFFEGSMSRRQRDAYLPFSAGPRFCPGHRLGMTEAMILLAMIARRYALRPLGRSSGSNARFSLRPDDGWPVETILRR